jgi:hypothetical protein
MVWRDESCRSGEEESHSLAEMGLFCLQDGSIPIRASVARATESTIPQEVNINGNNNDDIIMVGDGRKRSAEFGAGLSSSRAPKTTPLASEQPKSPTQKQRQVNRFYNCSAHNAASRPQIPAGANISVLFHWSAGLELHECGKAPT